MLSFVAKELGPHLNQMPSSFPVIPFFCVTINRKQEAASNHQIDMENGKFEVEST